MGWYDVVASCVVDNRHYIRPTKSPIQVDDGVAAPLVESGCLKPYQPGVEPPKVEVAADPEPEQQPEPVAVDEPAEFVRLKPPRSRRRSEDHEDG